MKLQTRAISISMFAIFAVVGYGGVNFLTPDSATAATVCGDEYCNEDHCSELVGHFCWDIHDPGSDPGCTSTTHC